MQLVPAILPLDYRKALALVLVPVPCRCDIKVLVVPLCVVASTQTPVLTVIRGVEC